MPLAQIKSVLQSPSAASCTRHGLDHVRLPGHTRHSADARMKFSIRLPGATIFLLTRKPVESAVCDCGIFQSLDDANPFLLELRPGIAAAAGCQQAS